MIVEVWDLLGSEAFARTVVSGREDRVDGATLRHLRHVLVYPKDDGSNRAPHLLDPERPDVADLLDPNGDIAPDIRERTWLMRELLLPEDLNASPFWQTPPDRRIFRDWFDYQRGVLDEADGERRSPDQTILAVPDFLGIKAQESLLSDSGFDRIRTRLLWRPIAAALGAEDMLEESGVSPGDRVAVLDVSPDGAYFDLCILKMVPPKDEDWSGASSWPHLVPCRATAPEMPRTAQDNGFFFCSPTKGGKFGENRIRFDLAMSFGGTFLLPRGGTWIEQDSSILPFSPSLRNVESNELRQKISETLASCKIALSVGAPFRKEAPFPAGVPLIREPEGRNWILRGCIRFAIREANGTPTYYDEMQGLFQVVRAEMEERIVPVEWIPPNSMAKGGGRVSGPPVKRRLIAGSESIQNHISFEKPTGTTHLREYIHSLKSPLKETVNVVYRATAVPGQGFAEIKVTGIPGQSEAITFDLRQTVPAFEPDGRPTTINRLEAKLDRSYPPEIPRVEAQDVNSEDARWPEIKANVAMYLEDSVLAADSFYVLAPLEFVSGQTDKERGLGVLKRYNVFGSSSEFRFPIDPSFPPERFRQVFHKLAEDWQRCPRNGSLKMKNGRMKESDFIRLIAWTYQRDNPVFSDITEEILAKAEKMVDGHLHGGHPVKLVAQEYTYLANMVTCPDGTNRLFAAFLKRFQQYQSVRDKALLSSPSPETVFSPDTSRTNPPPFKDKWYGSLRKAEADLRERERSGIPGWNHSVHYNPTTHRHEVITRSIPTGQMSLPGLFPEPKKEKEQPLADAKRKKAVKNAFQAVPIKLWAKTISIALMENEEAMKSIPDGNALAIVDAYRELMSDFLVSNSSSDVHKSLFRGLLFALKRRRFDRSFLSPDNKSASEMIEQIDSTLAETMNNLVVEPNIRTLAGSCQAFLHGKGNLMNLPSILSLNESSDDEI